MASSDSPTRQSPRLQARRRLAGAEEISPTQMPAAAPQLPPETRSKRRRSVELQKQFGGPIFQLLLMFGLPLLVFVLNVLVDSRFSIKDLLTNENPRILLEQLNISCGTLRSAFLILVSWLGFTVLLEKILPGEILLGSRLPDGRALPYRINGHLGFWIGLFLVSHGHLIAQFLGIMEKDTASTMERFARVADLFMPLLIVASWFSAVLALILYIGSFRRSVTPSQITKWATGNVINDFWMGREQNPRWPSDSLFDIKFHCMLRPGLIGWLVLNVCFGAKQYTQLGYVTPQMTLVIILQGVYIWDALYNEAAGLTTMDIITEGFGFMLVFGDLVWVPFTYSLQARYLLQAQTENMVVMSPARLTAIVVLFITGYTIFRLSNNQKNIFRKNPNDDRVQHLKAIQTGTGRRLLVTGWWGQARKINYTGDWMMALSWCLLCGFKSIVPYFYAISFFILLLHRAARDDHDCLVKYGSDWVRYKKQVPCLFIPKLI